MIGTGTPDRAQRNGRASDPLHPEPHAELLGVAGDADRGAVGAAPQPEEPRFRPNPESRSRRRRRAARCSGPAGEIYRLKASVATPACAASSPQAAIIITGFRNYGIILADNGDSGGLIGTPDARWNDNDLSCITSLTLADFEPVNVSSLMVSADSGATSK